jgi:hypothetical protein
VIIFVARQGERAFSLVLLLRRACVAQEAATVVLILALGRHL